MSKRRLSDLPADVEPMPHATAQMQLRDDGFRPKDKKASAVATDYVGRLPDWRRAARIDFVFENPLYGALWTTDAITLLKRHNSQLTGILTRNVPTSYCHYNTEYKKATNFFTSLVNFNLRPPCCPDQPCDALKARGDGTHSAQVAGAPQSVVNSVPEQIVHECLDAWAAKLERGGVEHEYKLVIDAFAGFGSVERHVKNWRRNSRGVDFTVGNDVVKTRDGFGLTMDMSKDDAMDVLMDFGHACLRQTLPAEGQETFSKDKVVVLLWLSTPCRTYSTQALGVHRPRNARISNDAAKDDAMNLAIAKWLDVHVLSP